MGRDGLDRLQEIGRLALAPGRDGAVFEAERRVGDHEAFVEEQLHPEPVAGGAGAEGRVEGEQARLDLGDGEAGDRAGEVFGEGDALGIALPSFGAVSRIAMPSARSSAVRNESASRVSAPSRTTIRSTTTSMSWRNFLSSVGGSSSS
jgi:hypothetical protein